MIENGTVHLYESSARHYFYGCADGDDDDDDGEYWRYPKN